VESEVPEGMFFARIVGSTLQKLYGQLIAFGLRFENDLVGFGEVSLILG
jgi:hypothetical protein